eukprot:15394826-Heterocapsa_arctica.AAC.1
MDFFLPQPTVAPTIMWSASNSLLKNNMPFQARMATPPDLPVMPSSFFYVTIAGCQTPCHPFR